MRAEFASRWWTHECKEAVDLIRPGIHILAVSLSKELRALRPRIVRFMLVISFALLLGLVFDWIVVSLGCQCTRLWVLLVRTVSIIRQCVIKLLTCSQPPRERDVKVVRDAVIWEFIAEVSAGRNVSLI